MNKELLKKLITEEINQKLISVLEEMSTSGFLDTIIEKYETETGVLLDEEDVHDLVGDKVFPLYTKITEYVIEHIV